MDKLLIDTDVILDFLFDRQPFAENAAHILSLCETKSIEGFITPVICSNLYYLLRQTAKHDRVIEKLGQLLKIVDVLDMNRDIVLQALGSGFTDFEDALQHFAAVQSQKIDVILTRNVKDFAKSEIGVMTPEGYLKVLAADKQ
jgi:predicted nucleic acid-binding protein